MTAGDSEITGTSVRINTETLSGCGGECDEGPLIELWQCDVCGAFISDWVLHVEWHRR